jgi:uncharacterized membrane protein
LALYPYFRALQGEKIENITPAFQTISLFSYVFANLLIGERLGSLSVILMIGIIVATSLFMRNFSTKTINRKGIGRMLLSSLLYACSFVGFKF